MRIDADETAFVKAANGSWNIVFSPIGSALSEAR